MERTLTPEQQADVREHADLTEHLARIDATIQGNAFYRLDDEGKKIVRNQMIELTERRAELGKRIAQFN
ncbi:hypothetical protein [Paraburkholderia hospita]|uniref:hypothetical protein n=1 Tax=Paraburkholderia hospita TaxID=169430 RepID=UPI00115FD6E7|nr:hypothetical protein [Paraburkholderia hospita]